MDTVNPGDYPWLVGLATANVALRAPLVVAAVRRLFGEEAARTWVTFSGGLLLGAYTIWLAAFWGFIYAAVFLGLDVVVLVARTVLRRRRGTNSADWESPDTATEIRS